jgi:hypothetical protein
MSSRIYTHSGLHGRRINNARLASIIPRRAESSLAARPCRNAAFLFCSRRPAIAPVIKIFVSSSFILRAANDGRYLFPSNHVLAPVICHLRALFALHMMIIDLQI